MEKKSIKALKIVSVFTLIFIIVGIMLFAFQTYFVFSRNGIDLNSPAAVSNLLGSLPAACSFSSPQVCSSLL